MRLALAQLTPTAGALDRNTERAREAVATAADRGADLVVLPELWDVGYFAFDSYERAAEGLDGDRLAAIRETAADEAIAVVAGTVVEDLAASAATGEETPADEGLANTAVVFDADGERRLVYRKHHLFGYDSAETRLLEPGERLPTTTLCGFELAVTTCYDLRFPEQFRALADRGATLVAVPSAWPYPRVEHWRTLPEARAVENLWYVAAANGVGAVGDERLVGRSTVYDPWGTTVVGAGTETGVVTAEVDPERVETVREEFGALGDRRPY
ncbi:nitrilase-related carbon-nitrogen hydrolase [Halobaculum sp. MBLA0147]|uniref:nitrilase-related carbon-nitrogen hydrolase n=1 Tax=Halobaculum sp. MBLA0147 TaxID=3079934 RepID=UPI0035240EC9